MIDAAKHHDIDPEEVHAGLVLVEGAPLARLEQAVYAAARVWLDSLPPDTTTPAPDVQAQIKELRRALDAANRLLGDDADLKDRLVRENREMQAQIDAARAEVEQRCAAQLADYIARAAADEATRIDAAVAREREECASLIANLPIVGDDGEVSRDRVNVLAEAMKVLSARSAKGVS